MFCKKLKMIKLKELLPLLTLFTMSIKFLVILLIIKLYACNNIFKWILIVPIFVNQGWFTRLLTLLIKGLLYLPSSDISLTFPYRRKSIPYLPKTRLMACCVSGDACKSRIFREKLQMLSHSHGDQGQVGNMISMHIDVCNFVVKENLVHMKQL